MPSEHSQKNRWRNTIGTSLVILSCFPLWWPVINILPSLMNPQPWNDHPSCPQTEMNTLQVSLTQYKTLNRELPTTEQGLEALLFPPLSVRVKKGLLKKYAIMDGWGHPYQYRMPSKTPGRMFDLWCLGPDGINGTEDDIHAED